VKAAKAFAGSAAIRWSILPTDSAKAPAFAATAPTLGGPKEHLSCTSRPSVTNRTLSNCIVFVMFQSNNCYLHAHAHCFPDLRYRTERLIDPPSSGIVNPIT
jgi:hypothetical protein